MTLQEFLDSVRDQPYEWGTHDCAMFAARATDAVYGTAYAPRVQAFGATSARAYRAIMRSGATLAALTDSVLGGPADGPPREGDVVLIGSGRRAALGIATPPVALAAGPVGFIPVPLSTVTRIWRVG